MFALISIVCQAQFATPEQTALKNIRKKKWAKAEQALRKSVAKDSFNTAGRYLLSVLFFENDNPAYNIDSAYSHVAAALDLYTVATPRERSRLGRIPIDSLSLVNKRSDIETAAFNRAKSVDTEGAYIFFLSQFRYARQRDEAISLRDEAAYQAAVKANTYQGYLAFLEKYPQAVRARDAQAQYERLLYLTRTQEHTLRSYELFLVEYPATPYRREAEQHILRIMTASGDPATFKAFIEKYPRSGYRKLAENFLYHIVTAEGVRQDQDYFDWSDSLANIAQYQNFLVPVLKENRFGFIDKNGQVVVPFSSQYIPEEYKCGNITEDVLVLNGILTGRSGRILLSDSVAEVEDLGIGFLKVVTSGAVKVIHKSGTEVLRDFDDVRIVSDRFLAVKKNQKWNIVSLTGLQLTTTGYDDISSVGGLVSFKTENKVRLSNAMLIGDAANGFPLKLSDPYDQVKYLSDDLYQIKAQGLEGILDKNLQVVLPVQQCVIEKTNFGFALQTADNVSLYTASLQRLGSFKKYFSSGKHVCVKNDSAMYFLDVHSGKQSVIGYDSIAFVGPYPVTYSNDSATVVFDSTKKTFRPGSSLVYLIKKDSTGFVVVKESGKRSVYDEQGRILFSADYDAIEYAGEDYFIVHKREKKGLVNRTGKSSLPVEYDAIGPMNNGIVTLLKAMKFGAYNANNKKLIKPSYEKNILVYNKNLLAVYQKGQYSFIDWSNKPIDKLAYDEVQVWSDSVALLRTGFNWKFHDLMLHKDLIQSVKKLHYIEDTDEGKLAIIKTDHHYGVVSNTKGVIIPPTFSYIVNVGSAEEPVYFTEKHVEEASIYVVIWYDANGKLLRREVYEEDDYERILCSNN